MSTETVEIEIGDQIFNLRSENGVEKLKELAEFVNRKLKEVDDKNPANLRVALLTLLNISEELFDERKKQKDLLIKLEARAEKIQNYLSKL